MKATFTTEQTVEQVHTVAKTLNEKNVVLSDIGPAEVETLLRKAGNNFGSVHFIKRGDDSLRKMSYRLHVTSPSHASRPRGVNAKSRKDVNKKNNQMTVFDVNKVLRNRKGEIKTDDTGKQLRGAWRTVPLENVVRIKVDGVTYQIK
jgi:hypothetical protein